MDKVSKKQKVFVGISGGVDSSVSAYLLKKKGYDVTGVFIKVYYPEFVNCNWRAEMQDAMRVCAKLDIPFLLCDAEKEYKEGVIDYMINEYRAGRTPNPDVMCNKHVKFDSFYNFAMKNGADYIATGHYAQSNADGQMYKGADQEKDQSYFLWTLTPEILSKTLFPVGWMQKTEVRKIAKKAGLLTAQKKDSQGLCFIGHVDMKDFLRNYIETKPGDALDEEGEVIGQHDGSILYTIGERHGFEIFDSEKSDSENPLYIVDKNLSANTITVSENKIENSAKTVELEKINLISQNLKAGDGVYAKTRYRQEDQKASVIEISNDDGKLKISFEKDQESITPGQSVVLYKEKECVGGGIIV
jgi:tRNA-specific 2-thiouridylase